MWKTIKEWLMGTGPVKEHFSPVKRQNPLPNSRVFCTMCHKTFADATDQPTGQGVGCSSLLMFSKNGDLLYCGYGSQHDMNLYKVQGPFTFDEDCNICDECIDSLVKDGILVLYKTNVSEFDFGDLGILGWEWTKYIREK